jgi:hypothetical protein
MIALRILAGVLWIAIKIVEHREAEPEIIIVIGEAELPMRDVTPRKLRAARGS